MPAIQTYDAKQGLAIGGPPSVQVDTSVAQAAAAQGRALQGLGQAAQEVAEHYIKREEETQRSKARLRLQSGQQAIDADDIRSAEKMPEDGEGWVAARLKSFDDQRTKVLADIPSNLREEYAQRWDSLRGEYENKYLREQVGQRTTWAKTNVTNQANTAAEAIRQDPNSFERWKTDTLQSIDEQPLQNLDKKEFRRKTELLLGEAFLLGSAARDPYGTRMAVDVPFVSPRARQVLSAILARDKQPEQHIDRLEPKFAEGLANMVTTAPPEIAKGLGIMSGARTRERQQQLWDASDKTGRTVGSPDGSKHVHGQAADLTFNGKRLDDPSVPQGVRDWVKTNAADFGLALPLDGKDGRADEPWHIEDVAARSKIASGGRPRAEGALFRGQSIAGYYQQSYGLSPIAAAAIGGHAMVENGGRSTGRPGDNGSAFGTFQWRGERLEGLKRFAGQRDADWRDQKTQLDYAAWEGENGDDGARRAWRELKTATTPEQAVQAFMHFERPAGYDANRPEAGHAYERRLQEAKSILGQKDGVGSLEQAQGDSSAAGSSMPTPQLDGPATDPRFAAVPFSVRMRVAEQLDAQIMQLGVEKRADLDIASDNAATAIQNTGEYSGQMPEGRDWVEAHGPVEGPRRAAAFEAAIWTARDIYAMRRQTPEEIQSVVNAATPQSSGTDAQVESQRFERLQKAADATLKQREDDPSGYAMQAFPNVRQAFASVSSAGSPEGQAAAFSRALQVSVEAQRSIGIKTVSPLPKTMADAVAQEVDNAEIPQERRAARLASTVFSVKDPEQQRSIFQQLVKAGVDPIAEGALEAGARGDTGAARRLMFAAFVDPAKLPGKLAFNDDAIKKQIQSDLMAPKKIGDAIYGLSLGASENAERATRDSELITRAVKLRLGKGESLQAAVAGAGKDLYGDKEVFQAQWGINAKLVVDKGEDTATLRSGLEALTPALKERAMSSVDSALTSRLASVPAATGERAVLRAGLANRIETALAEGVWRDYGDKVGFFDVYTGEFLTGRDGKPIAFSYDEVRKAGKRAPEPPKPSMLAPTRGQTEDVLDGGFRP